MKLYNTLIIHIQILSNVESNAEGINHYRMALTGVLSKDSMFTSPCASTSLISKEHNSLSQREVQKQFT
jgi:hypothetical protein